MKPFESSIGPLLKDYISYRAGLGYGEKELRRILIWLDRYIQEQKAGLGDLTPVFFLGLKKSHEKKRSSFNALLRAARGFFAYLERRRIVSENPLLDIESYPRNAFIPFVFSPEKTDALLFAAQKNIRKEDPDSFLRDYSAYLVIVLLARCGMRIKEPLHLTLQDYRPAEKTLYIEKTKFHKDRLIPVPTAAAMELDTYLRIRGSFVTGNKYLFAGKNGRALNVKNVIRLFDQSVIQIGLDRKKYIIGNTSFGRPTPHSLRHSFAINTLSAVRDRGGSPQNALPVLSGYLGHVKYRYTAVYLKVIDAEHRNALVDFAIERQEEI
jgi:site-specific recombinase XerD